MKTTTYDVLRQHEGDKAYAEGDTREANEADVAHLVASGVLRKQRAKATAPVSNKAVKPAANKAG